MSKYLKSCFGLGLISIAIALGMSSENPAIAQVRRPRQNIIRRWVNSIWGRRPKRSLGARSNIVAVSPGLIDTITVWHDKPMFLWHSSSKNQQARLIVRERNSEETLWEQDVNIANRKAFYQGQPLEPGKNYQWKLTGTTSSIPWTNFQIMPENQRAQIKADLQRLEQKSLTDNTSEETAKIKAEYFLNRSINQSNEYLWSDGLQALYQVKQPSTDFIKNRQQLITNILTPVRTSRKK
ncbi:hypothetical protein NIES267_07480 [Calothrix parasitica NIES-267]|uniref:DUF928 domain-containing protein n=1 Tax=Calothrix parasitica NIES-267 TaxID=1973488 RepID=A0A1Z4LJ67_9CYAN|nr:hypothetical protein NIES267_07480 [Calothrix parasitica NIES-267]